MLTKQEISEQLKAEALRLGFDACGIAAAADLEEEHKHFDDWLAKGYQAQMQYMERNAEKRLNPCLLVENARSVIVLLVNYKPKEVEKSPAFKIARFAYPEDYHTIIRPKLTELLTFLQSLCPNVKGRGFVDSAPVLERAWAVKAGLGWIGKNTSLISPKLGSFTFIAELIVDVELVYDEAYAHNGCGACNRCLVNCPTGALVASRELNACRCISYQTIENKDSIAENLHGWLFGCDVCLAVCPWNKRTVPHIHPEFAPMEDILKMEKNDWLNLTEEKFEAIFAKSPIARSRLTGIQRNLQALISEEK